MGASNDAQPLKQLMLTSTRLNTPILDGKTHPKLPLHGRLDKGAPRQVVSGQGDVSGFSEVTRKLFAGTYFSQRGWERRVRQGKERATLANISGAMLIQPSIPSTLEWYFTP